MSVIGCRPTTEFLTDLLAQPDFRDAMLGLKARSASHGDYVDLMARSAAPDVAATLRAEFAELPPLALSTLVDACALAHASERPLEVVSVGADGPIEFARHRRVRITIDVEEERIRIALSHVASHHATWYAAGALAETSPVASR